jgi:hypothetical protein
MRLKSLHGFSVIFLASFWLAGCGGSSSGGGGSAGGVPPTPFNVASQDNGGVATATYDSENAGIINDAVFDLVEGVNSGLFWSGNVNGDSVTIALDDDYLVSQITMYTNATNNTDTTIQYSTDGVGFTSIVLFSDCPTLALGSGRIACTLSSARQMSHLRVLVNSNAATVHIYELVAMGVLATP